MDMGLATDDINKQIQKLLQERSSIQAHHSSFIYIYLVFILSQFQIILQGRRHIVKLHVP
jgi:hypothetical protein